MSASDSAPSGGGEEDGRRRASNEMMLDEIDLAFEPVSESTSLAPAVGIAVAGGSMMPASESFRSGLTQAGPVAVAGLVVNGASALLVVIVAHLVTPRAYGTIAQLLGLYFILSMPGSAVLVGVVRRVSALQAIGHPERVHRWARKVHRLLAAAVVVELAVAWLLQGWIARQLSLPNDKGIVLILVASGIWILLCVDRGLLQSHRDYRALAFNLLMEGAVRTVCVVGFVVAGTGVSGYALGIFTGEVAATAHARWLASRAWPAASQKDPSTTDVSAVDETEDRQTGGEVDRRALIADVSAAFAGLALLGLLQNVDVILLGRLDHAQSGAYAAISVASKALVFGALALGAYLLPEATIRWHAGGHAVRQLVVTLTFLAVPAGALLAIALLIPSRFLALVFTSKLATAAPAFSSLVGAMIFLCISVLLTNYLFGAGCRWIVLLLAVGAALAVVLVFAAHGHPLQTARADLAVQAALAAAMGAAFVIIHNRRHGSEWRAAK